MEQILLEPKEISILTQVAYKALRESDALKIPMDDDNASLVAKEAMKLAKAIILAQTTYNNFKSKQNGKS